MIILESKRGVKVECNDLLDASLMISNMRGLDDKIVNAYSDDATLLRDVKCSIAYWNKLPGGEL